MTDPRPAHRRWMLPVLALACLTLAWSAAGPATTPSDDSELGEIMDGIKNNLKVVGMSMQDPEASPRVLDALVEMQALLLLAKREQPSNLGEQPADEREAHATQFRADMARALIETLELEIAVLEERREDAMGIVGGSLYELREASHAKYQAGDGEH